MRPMNIYLRCIEFSQTEPLLSTQLKSSSLSTELLSIGIIVSMITRRCRGSKKIDVVAEPFINLDVLSGTTLPPRAAAATCRYLIRSVSTLLVCRCCNVVCVVEVSIFHYKRRTMSTRVERGLIG